MTYKYIHGSAALFSVFLVALDTGIIVVAVDSRERQKYLVCEWTNE